MAGPVLLNQVIFQTPSVEKMQVNEQQVPDQAQRLASQEAMVHTRIKSETVQNTPKPEPIKVVDRESQSSGRRSPQKRQQPSPSQAKTAPVSVEPGEVGSIVDAVI